MKYHFLVISSLFATGLFAQGNAPKSELKVQNIEEPKTEYDYNPLREKDPFYVPLDKVVRELEKKAKRLSFLQDFPTEQIKVLGVMGDAGQKRKAVLSAPNKRSKTVQLGHPVGNNNGFVVGIFDEGIRIKEFTVFSDGSKKSRIVELKMSEKQDSGPAAASAPPPAPSGAVFKKVYEQLRRQGKDIDEMESHMKEVKE